MIYFLNRLLVCSYVSFPIQVKQKQYNLGFKMVSFIQILIIVHGNSIFTNDYECYIFKYLTPTFNYCYKSTTTLARTSLFYVFGRNVMDLGNEVLKFIYFDIKGRPCSISNFRSR